VLNADLIAPARAIDWIILYSDEQGFAQQQLVRGEAQSGATMDSDAKAQNQNYCTPSNQLVQRVGFANVSAFTTDLLFPSNHLFG
jgi:hypothetical protein